MTKTFLLLIFKKPTCINGFNLRKLIYIHMYRYMPRKIHELKLTSSSGACIIGNTSVFFSTFDN